MVNAYTDRFTDLITKITSHVPNNASDNVKAFVSGYFAKLPLNDLDKIDPKQAYAIAKSSYSFYQKRAADTVKIRLYSPSEAKDKWKSDGIVLEIINNDMPFLVDSLTTYLNEQGFSIYETIHPAFKVVRDAKGTLSKIVATDAKQGRAESFIHFQLSALPSGLSEKEMIAEIEALLAKVRMVVDDWQPMKEKVAQAKKRITRQKQFDADEVQEVKDFLTWLSDNNFVFFGHIEYDFTTQKDGSIDIAPVKDSAMGTFRAADFDRGNAGLESLPIEVRHFATDSQLIQITKSKRKSTLHRPVLMDYVAIKRFDTKGEVIGETRFLGMFTSIVYYQSADTIPFIRRKIERTLIRANYDPLSHNGKQLKAILEFYPRDELFQIDEADLFVFSIGMMSLETRPEVKLFVRKDAFERFMSAMVYVPRERFSTYLRKQIESILETAFKGKVSAYYTNLTDSPLVRLHLIVNTKPGKIPAHDVEAIEAKIAQVTNKWADSLRNTLAVMHDEKRAERLMGTYADAFPEGYISRYDVVDAAHDIGYLESITSKTGIMVNVFNAQGDKKDQLHLKLYSGAQDVTLSDMLPVLENMGCHVLDASPYTITPKSRKKTMIVRDFLLKQRNGSALNAARKTAFEEALLAVCRDHMADDKLNGLMLVGDFVWRDIVILRGISHYIQQIGSPYSETYTAEVLIRHAELAEHIIALFHARFDPALNRKAAEKTYNATRQTFYAALEHIPNLAEDKILRRFADIIDAMLRTNFFQTHKGAFKPYIAFKFDSAKVPGLPLPRPYREIFVYSMHTEGIHLRGDAVARGGLRWSDRPEDFRTEVLGLMKAQMVKNTVIVPQGSKGGFVVKRPPLNATREQHQEAGIASYKQFLSGLLDITDNIDGKNVIPPADVVRHDSDDPYLVVAADKGTATFSDIANSVSEAYGFWLGDAFASGGSAGYDHKAMGITAKGAWVSVQRHFMEMGKDIQKTDFTVAGIGDMAGDVFGNGMLLSEHIKLIAAFNHRHIFLDPTPDAAKSFKERTRLFALPRSSWEDYDAKLISKGGGVFDRSAKSIDLSTEMQKALNVKTKSLAPDELIKVILKSPVELLWNGGIGTYVKATHESHDDVGDRANNAVRINGEDLRCNVIGEGGNLGFTQLGRIEYARGGGRINTDAIDNSAGVDCSDHEVNIKIALGKAESTGKLTRKKRNVLLEKMTDEVSRLVLIDNRLQTQAITISEQMGVSGIEPASRMMQRLEQDGLLDRTVEFLPTEAQLAELRATDNGLSRPEIAVLLSYAKLALFRDLKDSSMLDSEYFEEELIRYFPKDMQEEYKHEILTHRLRREIIATIVTNSIANRVGFAFMNTMREETGMHPCDIARSYIITRDAFGLRELWRGIEALDGKISADKQAELFIAINQFVEHMVLWFLRHGGEPVDMGKMMGLYAKGVSHFSDNVESLMSPTMTKAYKKKVAAYKNAKVPATLAAAIAKLEALCSATDVTLIANRFNAPIDVAGEVYFTIGAELRMGWLRRSGRALASDNYWGQLATKLLLSDLYEEQRRLAEDAFALLPKGKEHNAKAIIQNWQKTHSKAITRFDDFIAELRRYEMVDANMLSVALRNISAIH